MNRSKTALSAILWIACGAAAPQEATTAEAILDKYVEVTGGKAAYAKIRNGVLTGRMEFVGKGIKGSLTSYKAGPRKSYEVVEIEGVGKIEQGTDGQVAWERSALQGPRIKEGEERASVLRAAAPYPEWRQQFPKVELAGEDTVDGRACYKLVLTPAEGKPETRWFDKKTGLLVKSTQIIKNPMGEIPAEFVPGDYKPVDGLLLPHRVTQKAINMEILVVVESVKHNVDLPADRFDLPEDVRALAEKRKKP